MGFCWYQLLAVSAPISLDITSLWILINITKNAQYYSEPQYHWYNSTLLITEYFLYYLILPNNTQYYCHFYWYYSILHAEVILEWSLSDSGYYSVLPILPIFHNISQYYPTLPNITQYYPYYPILLILPLLQTELTAPGYYPVLPISLSITNIAQYYKSNIHQYYTILQIHYYSKLHWWYSISILLNTNDVTNVTRYYLFNVTHWISNIDIPNPQNCVFPIPYLSIFLNITSHHQYPSIFLNISWATWRCGCHTQPWSGLGPQGPRRARARAVQLRRAASHAGQPVSKASGHWKCCVECKMKAFEIDSENIIQSSTLVGRAASLWIVWWTPRKARIELIVNERRSKKSGTQWVEIIIALGFITHHCPQQLNFFGINFLKLRGLALRC